MFTPIHKLPIFDSDKSASYQDRWQKEHDHATEKKILEMIRKGAGEDFLQWEFENNKLPLIETQWDLRGIKIFQEQIDFPADGTGWFEAIDFSYAEFYHSRFRRAVFSATFNFVRLYN